MKAYLMLWSILFLIVIKGYLTSSCGPHEFQCPSSDYCLYRHKWCNGDTDCNPHPHILKTYVSEEALCSPGNDECRRDLEKYYRCDNDQCIPKEGRCDGYPSCSDGSDELVCECEEVLDEMGFINYTVVAGLKRIFKCWKIAVPSNKFLSLEFAELHLIDSDKYIQLSWEKSSTNVTILPYDSSLLNKGIDTFEDTEISFKSISRARPNSVYFDSFSISYVIVDVLCNRSDSFRCSLNSCIHPEKQCDGVNDCLDGADERKCGKGAFRVSGGNDTRSRGLNWLINQRNDAWGWRENTHRAIVALYLGQGANFNGTNQEEDLTAKQLEHQVTSAILRNETDHITSTQLSMYINALLVICHDPRNFYGFDLVQILRSQLESSQHAHHPIFYLALCNAKETLTNESISKVLNILGSPSEYSYLTDVQSIAVIALSCLTKYPQFAYLKASVENATNELKTHQLDDGSFGNIYTTSLIVQALLATGKEEAKDLTLKRAVEFLKSKQNEDGSFGDFLATYFILPILNGKSLLDISKINCTEKSKMPKNGDPVSDITSRLGPEISVHYYLYIGDEREQIHPIFFQTAPNVTVLEMMRLAAEADPKFNFKSQIMGNKLYVYEVYGIANDPEDGKFWILYTGHITANSSLDVTSKSPDDIILKDKDKIVMWYKSADHY